MFYDSIKVFPISKNTVLISQHRWHSSDSKSFLSLVYCLKGYFSNAIPTITIFVSLLLTGSLSCLLPNAVHHKTFHQEKATKTIKYSYYPPLISQIDGHLACACLLPFLGKHYLEIWKCIPSLK